MSKTSAFHVRFALGTDSVTAICKLINEAYKLGELGIVVDTTDSPFERTNEEEVGEFIRMQKLLVAEKRDPSQEARMILGCIKMDYSMYNHSSVGVLGCLAVDQAYQRQGLGRKLIRSAEEYLKNEKKCSQVELELLAPSLWKHTHKEMLREWYTQRLGYELKIPGNYEDSTTRLPALSRVCGRSLLAVDADFTVYSKKL